MQEGPAIERLQNVDAIGWSTNHEENNLNLGSASNPRYIKINENEPYKLKKEKQLVRLTIQRRICLNTQRFEGHPISLGWTSNRCETKDHIRENKDSMKPNYEEEVAHSAFYFTHRRGTVVVSIPKESNPLWICVVFWELMPLHKKVATHYLTWKKSSMKLLAMKCIPSLIVFHVIVHGVALSVTYGNHVWQG